MRPAELHIVSTSPGCSSYRLLAAGRIVWSNRVHDRPEGHAGARERLRAWLQAHPYIVVLAQEGNAQQRRRA